MTLARPKGLNKMNVLKTTTNKKNQIPEPVIKMNIKTVNELRSIAKNQGLHGYYKLKKADFIALLSEQSTEEMPKLPPRTNGEKRPVLPVKIIPSLQEMD